MLMIVMVLVFGDGDGDCVGVQRLQMVWVLA